MLGCKYVIMQVYNNAYLHYACMQVCKYVNMQVCKYASIQVCKYACIHVCKYVGMQECKIANMYVYLYALREAFKRKKRKYIGLLPILGGYPLTNIFSVFS